MSYILEALKKAERSRQQHNAPHHPLLRPPASSVQPPTRLWRGIGLSLLLINGLLLSGLILSQTPWIVGSSETLPQQTAPPLAAEPAQPMAAERLHLATDPLPISEPVTLSQLPTPLGQRFAGLNLDLHVYGERSEQRFVVINSQRYRTGDWLAAGALLEAIEPDGVILSYGDTRFRLSTQP